MSGADDPTGVSRYYANPAEQKVLIAGLQRYFSLPERSQNRNRIAKEVSQYLRYFSPHWSHRAVRLWFNNNRHTYFETDLEPPALEPIPPVRTSSSAPVFPKLPVPVFDAVPPAVVSPIPSPNPQPAFQDHPPPFPSLAVVAPPLVQPLQPMSLWSQPTFPESTPDQSYSSLSHLFSEIKSTAERDSKYPSLVEQFDLDCTNLFTDLGEIQADRVDAKGRFTKMPFPEPLSASEILDFPVRSLSSSSADHILWQVRPYADTKVAAFETATLTPSLAALAYVPFASSQRTLAVTRYADKPSSWVAHALPIRSVIDSMAADAHFAYLLTFDRIFLVPLTRDGPADNAIIPPNPNGRIVAPFMEGAIAAFDGSPQLLYVTAALTVKPIATQYQGVAAIAPIDGRLVCGVSGSAVVRLLTPDGREARAFVGHVAPVTRLARLSEQLFASSGEDATVRVWDLRERFPVVSVVSDGVPVMNVGGSSNYLITGMRGKAVNVFDLRNSTGRPMLGVAAREYDPVSLYYNQNEDLLAMFGVVERKSGGDATARGESQSKQRTFRIYRDFVGLDTH